MKRETHSDMFLFATSFSWWSKDLQVAFSRLQPGFPTAREARLKPAQGAKLLADDHRLKSVANKVLTVGSRDLREKSSEAGGDEA